ncbi:DUF362 domain-containing protein [candidate division KSB1 bacterium]|nr:DUF362 domain-containing protein [candidate division KSB1 bacterium]
MDMKKYPHQIRHLLNILFFPILGILSLIWFLFRVIPKPTRATYPCQRVAVPMATSFVIWLLGLFTSSIIFHKTRQLWKKSRSLWSFLGVAFAFVLLIMKMNDSPSMPVYANRTAIPFTDPVNDPVGSARGIYPGRVVWIYDSLATTWNGQTGHWWDDNGTDQEAVSRMLSKAIQSLTGQTNDQDAWQTLFTYFNHNNEKGDIGYQAGEKVSIKLNLVNCRLRGHNYHYGNYIYSSPQMVLALLRQLVNEAGVPDSCITFYDTGMEIPYTISQRCFDEFPNVRFVDFIGGDGIKKYKRNTAARVNWSEKFILSEAGGGNPAYLPTVVTEAHYIINLANMKGHGGAGITLCAKNHFGSICADRFGRPTRYAPSGAGLHPYIVTVPFWNRPIRTKGMYNPLVDLMGHRDLGNKTLLFMVDGLYATQSEELEVSLDQRLSSPPFNGGWSASLFVSLDGVALESVIFDFFRTEPAIVEIFQQNGADFNNIDNYLHEAALADNSPSGTVYDPEGDGIPLTSLGVHEHWNNPVDRQYSGNLGTGEGIELVSHLFTAPVHTQYANPVPHDHSIIRNYPNPFNSGTVISFSILKTGWAKIKIFNILGAEVVCLTDSKYTAGQHTIHWDGKDSHGLPVNSGMYFATIDMTDVHSSAKLLLTR